MRAGAYLSLVVLLLVGGAALAATNRGVPVNNGDKFTGELDAASDVDCFVMDLTEGGAVTVSVKASKGSALLPTIELRRPDGAVVPPGSALSGESTSKVSLKKFSIGQTGTWAVCIKPTGGSTGSYDAAFKAKASTKVKEKGIVVPASGTADVSFAGADGAALTFSVKDKGAGIDSVTVLDPGAEEVPGAAALTLRKGIKISGKKIPLGQGFGEYVLRLKAGSGGATVDVQTAVKFAKTAKQNVVLGPEPTLTTVSPTNGRDGIAVTLTGTNFVPGTRVFFGSVEATVTGIESSTRLTCTAPGGSDSTNGRTVDVQVLAADGQEGIKLSGFRYHGIPFATAVSPTVVPVAGGTSLTFTGTHIRDGATLTIGGVTPEDIVVLPPTQITCTAPARPPGIAAVVLKDEYDRTGTVFSGLSYLAPPTLASASPATVPSFGGRTVTLSGTNFSAALRVFVGGVQMQPVVVTGTSSVSFTAPAGVAGGVTVEVRDALDQSATRADILELTKSFVNVSSTAVPGAPAGTDFFAGKIGLGDLDGDEDPDMVLVSEYLRYDGSGGYFTSTRVLLNDGAGAFTHATATHAPYFSDIGDYGHFNSVAMGDLDGDEYGDTEVILSRIYPVADTNYFFLRDGKYYAYYIYYGSFVSDYRTYVGSRFIDNDGSGHLSDQTSKHLPPTTSAPWFGYGERWQGVSVLGDVDGDKDLDLVVSHPSFTFEATTTTFAYNGYYYLAQSPAYVPATRVLLNDGTGNFTRKSDAMPANLVYGNYPYEDLDASALVLADLDGENGNDLLLVRSSAAPSYGFEGNETFLPAARVLLNDGSGVFTQKYPAFSTPHGEGTGSGDYWQGNAAAVGDLDGDGSPEVVVGRNFAYYWYDGNTSTYVLRPALRIFTNDKSAFFTEATGNFLPSGSFETGSKDTVMSAHAIVLGDVDGDDDLDMLVTGEGVYYVYDATGTGYGTYGVLPSGYRVATHLFLNDGTGSMTDATGDWLRAGVNGDWLQGSCLALGDLDGDGDTDLVLGSEIYPDPYYYTPPHNRPLRVFQAR